MVNINETKLIESKGLYIYGDNSTHVNILQKIKNYKKINNSVNHKDRKGGQLHLIANDMMLHTINKQVSKGYATSIDLILKQQALGNTRIISVYMPTGDIDQKNMVIEDIEKWIKEALDKRYNIILLGDF